jgi:putative PIG3 family NAD(P)H quinone oxidoreductase
MSESMQALFVQDGALALRDTPRPVPADDEVLVKVACAGLNRADLFQVEGSYPPPPGVPDIPGLEISGIRMDTGEAVCALLPGAGYAQYAAVKRDHLLPVPAGISLQEAAALPECVLTCLMALWDEGEVKPGEAVLVHGGAGGIGTTAIQMLTAFGCTVFATAGSAEKVALCEALGATGIDYKQQDFVEVVKAAGGVDVVLDMVGGDYIARNLKSLRRGGRLISLAFLQGAEVSLSAGGLLLKQLRWSGCSLRGRSDAQKAAYAMRALELVWPWVASGAVKAQIHEVYPFEDAAKAQEMMRNYLHKGKLLLEICPQANL